MKKNLLKGVMAMAFAMFAMGTFAQGETKVLTASGDTWVRSNSPSNTWGTQETLEMKTDATNDQNFYGLLSFDVPATDDGYQVKSATLRLVSQYKKGDHLHSSRKESREIVKEINSIMKQQSDA